MLGWDTLEETHQPDTHHMNSDSWSLEPLDLLKSVPSSFFVPPRIWDMLPASPDNITHINSYHKQLFSCIYIYTLQRGWYRRSILNQWSSVMERNSSFRESIRKSRRFIQQQTGSQTCSLIWSSEKSNQGKWQGSGLGLCIKPFYP